MIFGSGPERILDALFAQKPHAFHNFSDSVISALMPGVVPTVALPVVEQFANRSTFTDRTLIPAQQEKMLPEYQYTPYTTETSKALGQLLGAFPGAQGANLEQGIGGSVARSLTSPILLENYLRAWTGNMGMYALQAADKGLRTAGVLPDPPKAASTLADIPFVRAFMVRYPSASAQSIQDFHDEYARNKTYFDTWNYMAKQGNTEAMARIEAVGGQSMLVHLNGIETALNENSKIIQDVNKNPNIPATEKRQLIDTSYWRMAELAQMGNQAMRSMQGSLARRPVTQ